MVSGSYALCGTKNQGGIAVTQYKIEKETVLPFPSCVHVFSIPSQILGFEQALKICLSLNSLLDFDN